jgi:hypothetical protein
LHCTATAAVPFCTDRSMLWLLSVLLCESQALGAVEVRCSGNFPIARYRTWTTWVVYSTALHGYCTECNCVQAAHEAHGALGVKTGRELAPYLRALIGPWCGIFGAAVAVAVGAVVVAVVFVVAMHCTVALQYMSLHFLYCIPTTCPHFAVLHHRAHCLPYSSALYL